MPLPYTSGTLVHPVSSSNNVFRPISSAQITVFDRSASASPSASAQSPDPSLHLHPHVNSLTNTQLSASDVSSIAALSSSSSSSLSSQSQSLPSFITQSSNSTSSPASNPSSTSSSSSSSSPSSGVPLIDVCSYYPVSDLAVIDEISALEQCCEWSFLVELLDDIILERDEIVTQVRNAILTNDHETYRRQAYCVKGCALNLHLTALEDISRKAERLGKQLDISVAVMRNQPSPASASTSLSSSVSSSSNSLSVPVPVSVPVLVLPSIYSAWGRYTLCHACLPVELFEELLGLREILLQHWNDEYDRLEAYLPIARQRARQEQERAEEGEFHHSDEEKQDG